MKGPLFRSVISGRDVGGVLDYKHDDFLGWVIKVFGGVVLCFCIDFVIL